MRTNKLHHTLNIHATHSKSFNANLRSYQPNKEIPDCYSGLPTFEMILYSDIDPLEMIYDVSTRHPEMLSSS